jgi:hypothetical protein
MSGTAKSFIALLLVVCFLAAPVLTSCNGDGTDLLALTPPGETPGDTGTPAAGTPSQSGTATPSARSGTATTAVPSPASGGAATATSRPTASATGTASPSATSSPSATPSAAPTAEAPEPVGAVLAEAGIPAATGGTFAAADGSMTLSIPPGALPEDTIVQVRMARPGDIPEPEDVYAIGPVYDFQPDGLVLNKPATVTYRVPAEQFAGLNLDEGQQPMMIALTRSGDGSWEVLSGVSTDVDIATGEMVLTAEMNHFCSPAVLATPVSVRMDPQQVDMDAGQSWSTSIIITNDHLTIPVYVQSVDFYSLPGLSVSDGGGDINSVSVVQPGDTLTVIQDGRNRLEAEGPGEFGARLAISWPGAGGNDENAQITAFVNILGWQRTVYPGDIFYVPSWGETPPATPQGDANPDETVGLPDIWTTDTVVFHPHDRDSAGDTNPDDTVSPGDFAQSTNTAPETIPSNLDPRWDFWNIALGGGHPGLGAIGMALHGLLMVHGVGGGGIVPCFAADTLVLMADGSAKRIADIQPGDAVVSYDTAEGRRVEGTVSGTGNGRADYYYLVNGGLKVTPPHPFYVVDKGWTKVADLRPGDVILGADGPVTIVSIERIEEGQAICNISVSGYGNYFVSGDGTDFFLVKEGP